MSMTECQMLKSNTRTLFGRTTSITTPHQSRFAGAAYISPSVASQSDRVKETARLVAKLLQEGMVVLAASYGVKVDTDLAPMLRRSVPKEIVDEYVELVEELR